MMEIDVGIEMFSLVMGGELRLIERLPGVAPSTSILVRGGAGSGKTALGLHLAAGIARKLGGDVAYACVEIVPAELRAIHDGVAVKKSAVVELTSAEPADSGSVRIFAANLAVVGVEKPDEVLPGEVERFVAEAVRASATRGVRVLVLDSLSQGYGLGLGAPRALADGLVKFAAERGLTVVLLEETVSSEPSQWCFAVDTVLELSGADGLGPGARWMRVTKHRYAAATVGPHLLEIDDTGVELHPAVPTYRSSRLRSTRGNLGTARAVYTSHGQEVPSVPEGSRCLYVNIGLHEPAVLPAGRSQGFEWLYERGSLEDFKVLYRLVTSGAELRFVVVQDLATLQSHPHAQSMFDSLVAFRELASRMGYDVYFVDSGPPAMSLAATLAMPG